MVSSIKEKFENKIQVQNKSIRFCLNLRSRSRINPLHFRKKVAPSYLQGNTILRMPFLSTQMESCQDIFVKYLSLWSANIA